MSKFDVRIIKNGKKVLFPGKGMLMNQHFDKDKEDTTDENQEEKKEDKE